MMNAHHKCKNGKASGMVSTPPSAPEEKEPPWSTTNRPPACLG